MKIKELISAIEVFAAPELAEEWDNVGLITGNKSWECTGALVSLDTTIDVIREAIEKGCNLVISHHPLLFRPVKKILPGPSVNEALILAIKNDIAIYAAHTNLDHIILGVNQKIGERLGLQNARVLIPKRKMLRRLITFAPVEEAEKVRKAVFDAGAGQIGKYSECSFNTIGEGTFKAEEGADPYVGEVGELHKEKEVKIEIVYPFYLEEGVVAALTEAHPYEEVAYDIFTMDNVHFGIGAGQVGELEQEASLEELLTLLSQKFSACGLRYTPGPDKIKKVAVCGGSGSFAIGAALRAGAQALVTADLKYHDFFEGEGRIALIDIGHYESEQFTIELIHDLLRKKFPTFAVLKTGVNTNPVRFFAHS